MGGVVAIEAQATLESKLDRIESRGLIGISILQ